MAFSSRKDSATAPEAAADAWFTPGRFAILLTLLVIATFPAIVAGDSLVYRDFGYVTVPFAKYVRDSFLNGEVPLWNPLSMCGLPFLAQWNTQPLYPPALIYVLIPGAWAVNLFCLLHLIFGGLGMYRLAKHWTNDSFAAALAGTAFAFSAVFLNCLTWVHSAAALGWMPWVVLATRRTNTPRSFFVAAMAGALQMLTGSPEIILQTWIIIAALAFWRWLPLRLGSVVLLVCLLWAVHLLPFLGLQAWMIIAAFACWRWFQGFRNASSRPLERDGESPHLIPLRLGGVVLLVCLLTAVQLLPFLDLLKHSHRTGQYGGSSWAMPASGWANFFVPLFNSAPWNGGVFAQNGQAWISSYYLGIPVVLLGIFAVCRVPRTEVRLFAFIIVASLLLAMGENSPVYGWLRAIVPLGFMRFPVKFVVLIAFLLPVLAAFGVAHFRSTSTPEQAQRILRVIGIVTIACIGGIIWYSRGPTDLAGLTSTQKSGLSRAAFASASVLLLCLRVPDPRITRWFPTALLLIVWLDLFTHSPNAFPIVNASVFTPGLTHEQFQSLPKLGESRAMLSAEANYAFFGTMLSDHSKDYIAHRAGLYSNCNLLDDIPKVDGFYSLYPREIWQTLAPIYIATKGYPARLADFLGASQVTAPGEALQWQSRTSNLPLITIGQLPVFADRETTLKEIYQTNFNGREVVYLPTEIQGLPRATNSSSAKILSSKFQPHRISISTDATEPAMVVVAQSYFHWWQAKVNGQAVPIWRANHGFQALEVPAGKAEVELVYDDRGFRYGAIVSALAWIICVGGWFAGRSKIMATQ